MNTQYWNSLAKNFTDHVLEISGHDSRGVLKEEINRAASKSRVAADLGCGAGSLLKVLSPKFKAVYAVDYAVNLLELARQRNNLSNVKYLQHNLSGKKPLSFKADVTFCVNALISPVYIHRKNMADCVYKATQSKGLSVFVVPSFESILHTYHVMIRCQTRQGKKRASAVREMERLHRREVKEPVDGIVDIGGTLTKCFTQESIAAFLSDTGYDIVRIRKIEYPWKEEIDNPPRWLASPYPWDWFVLAKKR